MQFGDGRHITALVWDYCFISGRIYLKN